MALNTPLSKNSYRDQMYIRLFNNICFNKNLLEQTSTPKTSLWDSRIAARIDDAAGKNVYRSYRKNSTAPEIYLIGYGRGCLDKKTIPFLESLARQRIFEEGSFLAEGYIHEAVMLSRANPVTNAALNALYSRYKLRPRGNDHLELRERQYSCLQEITDLQRDQETNEEKIKEKVLEAMDCLVRRERDYFLPAIVEQKKKGKPAIFLTNLVHALSSNFPIVLNNNEVKYAVFVPRV